MRTILNNRWVKLVKQLFFTILLTVTSLFCALKTDLTFYIIIGWFGTFFFGIGGTYAFVRDLIYNIKGRCWVLILNEGLLIGKTLIHWENIEGFGKWNGGVLVFTNNVEERLAAANLIKRWNMKLSIKMSKTDILAPELGFEGSCNDFIAQCEEELLRFKKLK